MLYLLFNLIAVHNETKINEIFLSQIYFFYLNIFFRKSLFVYQHNSIKLQNNYNFATQKKYGSRYQFKADYLCSTWVK